MSTQKFLRGLWPSIAALVLAVSVHGQFTLVHTAQGTNPGDSLGSAVRTAGDLNQDGFDDYLVGANRADRNGPRSGMAMVYSGLDHSVLYSMDGVAAGAFFGTSVSSLDDVNGDGVPEFMVGASGSGTDGAGGIGLGQVGYVRVYSGIDGTLLYQLNGANSLQNFGFSIAGTDDIDLDGFPDILVGAPGFGLLDPDPGHVYIYSGVDGTLIRTLVGSKTGSNFGRSVSSIGDLDQDGAGDLIVGAPLQEQGGFLFSGAAHVISGADGSLIREHVGGVDIGTNQSTTGFCVSGLGDLNGNGTMDYAVGARLDSTFGFVGGSVRVFDGNGTHLDVFQGPTNGGYTGFWVDRAGDVDGDLVPDVILSGPISGPFFNGGGWVRVFSGGTGQLIFESTESTVSDFYGFSASGAGDVNGDGFDDIIIGAPGFGADDQIGSRYEVFLAPRLPRLKYSSQLETATLDLRWIGLGGVISAVAGRMQCRGATPGAAGLFAISFAPGDFALAPGLPLLLAVDGTNFVFAGLFGFDAQGEVLSAPFSRQIPSIAGSDLYYQFFEISPVFSSSNGIRLAIVP